MVLDTSSREPVLLPALGESVTEGTVLRWLKDVGDHVEADEPLLEVSTDKVDTEIPAPATGTLLEILVQADQDVAVGTHLATIGVGPAQPSPPPASDPASDPAVPVGTVQAEPADSAEPETAPEAADPGVPVAVAVPADTTPPRVPRPAGSHLTPVVRRLAAEHSIDLGAVTGTGLDGRVRKQDVLAAAARVASPEAATSGSAARLLVATPTNAQLTSVVEVDLTDLLKLRQSATDEVAPSVIALVAKTCVDALKAHPAMNTTLDGSGRRAVRHDQVDLALAMDGPGGRLTPVVPAAGDLSLAGLHRRIEDLTGRARTGDLAPEETAGGTFSLIDSESRGSLLDTPIVTPPQVGVLAIGAVVRRPVVLHDERLGETIAIRSMSYLALSYDHRWVDGADAARFLTDVRDRLERAQAVR